MKHPITNEESTKQPIEKKAYVAPKLTRHGAVEELTHLISNPGPSQPLPR